MRDCVSLEMAKVLEASGFDQKPYETNGSHVWQYRHYFDREKKNHIGEYRLGQFLNPYMGKGRDASLKDYAAPTLVELLDLLPTRTQLMKRSKGGAYARYNKSLKEKFEALDEKNPADALAKLWIAYFTAPTP